MTDGQRAIRLDGRFQEPAAFDYPWSMSSKGNPWVRVGNATLVVSEMRYKPGKFSFSFIVDIEPPTTTQDSDGNTTITHHADRNGSIRCRGNEYVYDTIEDAKRGALAYAGAGRGRVQPTLYEAPPESEDSEPESSRDRNPLASPPRL